MSDTRAAKVEDASEVENQNPAVVEDAAGDTGKEKGKEKAGDGDDEQPEEKLSEEETRAKVARLVAEGKKAVALKQWEEGVAKYGEALETQRQLVGDYDITMAPLLYSYGRALYELVLTQQGVMGKEEVAKNTTMEKEDAGPSNAKTANFVFGGDGDEDDDEEGEEQEEQEGGEGGEDEPEDDFNAAWDVLDVARTIYARELEKPDLPEDKSKATRLVLADCYLSLADISLETENFPQAVQDYTSAVQIQQALLPASSRALASSHYQLGTVLEFTPGGRSAALKHVQAALDGFKLRAAELKAADGDDTKAEITPDVARLTPKEREAEARDVASLIGDLEVKIEELNAAPPAQDFVAESINHLLGGAPAPSGSAQAAAPSSNAPVNDLTSMVRKKKKPAAAAPTNGAASDKRPADEEAGGMQKKPKTGE